MRLFAGVLLASVLSGQVLAEQAPRSGPEDSRIRFIMYDENQVFRIDASYSASTTIVFGEDEKIETIAAGDAGAWKIEPNKKGNVLFLKPVDKKASGNLNVITTKRQYVFLLTSAFRPASQQVYKVVFKYPDETLANRQDFEDAKALAKNPNLANLNVANVNSNYGYKGSSLYKPVVVFDDGIKTFFRFSGAVPAIFAVDATRNETVVNVHREGDYVIVDKVNPQWTIRNGLEQTCIFNLRFGNLVVNTGLDPFAPKRIPTPLNQQVPSNVAN
jgi:P-type conjugative transfer protein VirB9